MNVHGAPAHAADPDDVTSLSAERRDLIRRHPVAEAARDPEALLPDVVETQLVDLSDISLMTLRSVDADAVAPSLRRLLEQVESPRANAGGSGPPGRVD
jgi:hypothetical protein